MSHVFISYARADRDYARALADDLRAHSFDVWIDDRIDYGAAWWQQVMQGVASCGALIVLMTPESVDDSRVLRESEAARQAGRPVLPLRLRGEPLAWLSDAQVIDVRDGKMPGVDFYERLMGLIRLRPRPGEVITPPPPDVKTRPFPPRKSRSLPIQSRQLLLIVLIVVVVLLTLLAIFALTRQPGDWTTTIGLLLAGG
jgi:hypothetical protein